MANDRRAMGGKAKMCWNGCSSGWTKIRPNWLCANMTVEHPYGRSKSWMGATHFKMRRLKNVAAEMALQVLADNMTHVMKIIGIPALFAAMSAQTAAALPNNSASATQFRTNPKGAKDQSAKRPSRTKRAAQSQPVSKQPPDIAQGVGPGSWWMRSMRIWNGKGGAPSVAGLNDRGSTSGSVSKALGLQTLRGLDL
ncbi:MAG: hypothetical protein AAGG57_09675 [Pseudomonadota bacterium]